MLAEAGWGEVHLAGTGVGAVVEADGRTGQLDPAEREDVFAAIREKRPPKYA